MKRDIRFCDECGDQLDHQTPDGAWRFTGVTFKFEPADAGPSAVCSIPLTGHLSAVITGRYSSSQRSLYLGDYCGPCVLAVVRAWTEAIEGQAKGSGLPDKRNTDEKSS